MTEETFARWMEEIRSYPDGNVDAVYETVLQEFQFCMDGCIPK